MALAVLVLSIEFALSGLVATQIDLGEQVPIHWGIDGRADGYGPAWLALLLGPLLTAGLAGVFALIPAIDPRRANLERSREAYRWMVGSILAFVGLVHVLVLLAAMDTGIDVTRLIGIGIGLLLVVIGNFLGKLRSTWFVGIRTPWTLSSERAWARTHRLGGYLFVALGLVIALSGMLLPVGVIAVVAGIGAAIVTGALVLYSFFAWRDDPERRGSS